MLVHAIPVAPSQFIYPALTVLGNISTFLKGYANYISRFFRSLGSHFNQVVENGCCVLVILPQLGDLSSKTILGF